MKRLRIAVVGVFFLCLGQDPALAADSPAPSSGAPVLGADDVGAPECSGPAPGVSPQVAGACCVATGEEAGECVHTSLKRCAKLSGSFQGAQTKCRDVVCGTSACCLPAGVGYVCEVLAAATCTASGGTPVDSATCDGAVCPGPRIGSCCTPGVACSIGPQDICQSGGGTYRGDGTTCSPPCPGEPTGGCCVPQEGGGSACVVTSQVDCVARGGAYWGSGSDCSTFDCPPRGACCSGSTLETCSEGTAAECAAQGGYYHGDQSTCSTVVCPPPFGACCSRNFPYETYHCVGATTQSQCLSSGLGLWQGAGSTCGTVNCHTIAPGACCVQSPTGYPSCITTTYIGCISNGGSWVGAGTICGYAPYCG